MAPEEKKAIELVQGYIRVFHGRVNKKEAIEIAIRYCNEKTKRRTSKIEYWEKVKSALEAM